jgi:hypothetical protein
LIAGEGDQDNSLFTINGDALRLKDGYSFNYEVQSNYQIRILATDLGGLSLEKAFILNVLDINEPPTAISLDGIGVSEGKPNGTLVGNLTAVDPDQVENLTFTLVPGEGDDNNDLFLIAGSDLKTNAIFDYDIKNSYTIRIQVVDKEGLSVQTQFTISILLDLFMPLIGM